MGKPTKGQREIQARTPPRGEAPVAPVHVAREGVIVTRQEDIGKPEEERNCINFEGDFEAQLTPGGDVAILEMVPDVGNKNDGQPIPTIRRFINHAVWADVILR